MEDFTNASSGEYQAIFIKESLEEFLKASLKLIFEGNAAENSEETHKWFSKRNKGGIWSIHGDSMKELQRKSVKNFHLESLPKEALETWRIPEKIVEKFQIKNLRKISEETHKRFLKTPRKTSGKFRNFWKKIKKKTKIEWKRRRYNQIAVLCYTKVTQNSWLIGEVTPNFDRWHQNVINWTLFYF